MDDTELILQAQQGDRDAFEKLVYRYDKQVLSIALTYVNNAEDAKDIYQEVFLRVYRALPKFKFRSSFWTWLYRITTNVCLTHRAQHNHHDRLSLDQDLEEDRAKSRLWADNLANEAAAEQYTYSSEIVVLVKEAMNALSPQQKMVFTLRHYHGYKLREIASILDCAEGTVKKYLFVATERMREQLKNTVH
ncbi:sigma-70 family RNA polymerase sigma factor [Acidobacteria bacterium AH-259-A15]|nr:sigma-70 family RNA polymerase sigma factor [Acidobacteria bacterium AH-259-A15]